MGNELDTYKRYKVVIYRELDDYNKNSSVLIRERLTDAGIGNVHLQYCGHSLSRSDVSYMGVLVAIAGIPSNYDSHILTEFNIVPTDCKSIKSEDLALYAVELPSRYWPKLEDVRIKMRRGTHPPCIPYLTSGDTVQHMVTSINSPSIYLNRGSLCGYFAIPQCYNPYYFINFLISRDLADCSGILLNCVNVYTSIKGQTCNIHNTPLTISLVDDRLSCPHCTAARFGINLLSSSQRSEVIRSQHPIMPIQPIVTIQSSAHVSSFS